MFRGAFLSGKFLLSFIILPESTMKLRAVRSFNTGGQH